MLASFIMPNFYSVASAEETVPQTKVLKDTLLTKELEGDELVVIYEIKNGNAITSMELEKQKSRSITSSLIVVGFLWKYTTKSDGTTLRNMFRKCATVEGVAELTASIMVAGLATGPLTVMIGTFAGISAAAMYRRFTEGANLIYAHPASGKIYMYLDHCTYAKI